MSEAFLQNDVSKDTPAFYFTGIIDMNQLTRNIKQGTVFGVMNRLPMTVHFSELSTCDFKNPVQVKESIITGEHKDRKS